MLAGVPGVRSMSSGRRDPYLVLGISRGATASEARRAYLRLSRLHHPDLQQDDRHAAERRFMAITRAYREIRTYHAAGTSTPPDVGLRSDFYMTDDPLTIADAARVTGRNPSWLRRMVREGRLAAERRETSYLLRRRDLDRLDRTAPRRKQGN